MTRGRIIFIDDERELCVAAEDWLGASGFTVTSFTEPGRAVAAARGGAVDCVVTDIRMPGMSGQEVLRQLFEHDAELPVVLLTGHGDVTLAVECMRAGAYDFIEKPYDADRLVSVLDRAVEKRRMAGEIARLRAVAREPELDRRLVGLSPKMEALRRSILQLASIDVDVLINGETGTGKEVIARALHDFGPRRNGQFVAINCAAIPESVFESEMFGHAKGAFTGAVEARLGRIEYARGGTVFLDEIESMPLSLQAKVLRVIQERVVEPLGSNGERPIDVRFVAATKIDLKAESEAGRFRHDLYFRLSTVELAVPPLRERREDIALLYRLFVEQAAQKFGLTAPSLRGVTDQFVQSQWLGNVRELKAYAERAVLGMGGAGQRDGDVLGLAERVARFEAGVIEQALQEAGGSTAAAAERLAVPRRTLNEKIAKYQLRVGQADEMS